MLEQILPSAVATVETCEDIGVDDMFTAEAAVVAGAIDRRKREFATVRRCARQALGRLGVPAVAVLPGAGGAPLWPRGVVGSMTHCAGFRAACVAHESALASLGVDAEEHAPLPDGVLDVISLPGEREQLRHLEEQSPEGLHWDRLLFSAKEAVYKAWFPLAQRWLGFENAALSISAGTGTFTAQLLVEGPAVGENELTRLAGRWLVRDGLVLTAVAVPPRVGPPQTQTQTWRSG